MHPRECARARRVQKYKRTLRPTRRAVAEFIYHYHGELNHQGLGNAFVFLDTTRSRPSPRAKWSASDFFAKGYVHITNSKQRKHPRIPRASKLLICGLFQKGRVSAQDEVVSAILAVI